MKRNSVYQLAVAATVAAVFVTSAPLCASGADVPSPTNAPGLIGGSPASCGYSWVPGRQGWLGPDGTAFVPAKDKPGWAAYIPANRTDTSVSPVVRPVESAVAQPVVPPATEVHPAVQPDVNVRANKVDSNVSPAVRPGESAVGKPVAASPREIKPVAAPVKEVRPAGQPAAPAPVAPAGK